MAFYNQNINEIFKTLKTSHSGLNSTNIESQAIKFGTNELETPQKVSFFKKLFIELTNIMIIILILSATISCVFAIINHDTESLFEGLLIFAIVIINAIVGVLQSQKAENALEKLKSETEPFATVIRDGSQQQIAVCKIVVGDIILLKTGNKIPVDARIIECANFKCNESSITGESHSIEKTSNIIPQKSCPIQQQHNMCFSGTAVTSGTAKCVVTAVGKNTEFGKITKNLTKNIKEKTPLEKNIDKIGKIITYGVLGIVFVVFIVQVFFNKILSPLDAILTAVTLAVAAIPESLPAVITIIMALGVQKLARQNAIIKKLSAVETLGCCNVICTDKTGTLTKNEMQITHIFNSQKLEVASSCNITNTPLETICCLCINAKHDKNKFFGDATEQAILKLLIKKNTDYLSIQKSNPRIFENEFNSKRKIMSVVCKHNNTHNIYTKGALDYILPKCSHVQINEKIEPLTKKIEKEILQANQKLCLQGERVIAFAYQSNITSYEESNLIFAGFASITDPPKEEAIESIKSCKKAGLKTIMITGDHQTTAFAIAKQLGIASHKNQVLTGTELEKLSSDELSKMIHKYSVFARVSPDDKHKIVTALKMSGNVVSMTGDGINDAPSIKTANIGICMGKTGTDVTKEVADIVIADDNFSTIVLAIKEGRTVYKNITKTIVFLLSTNLVEVLGIFVTSLVLHDAVFLLPTQILFINLVTDSLPAFALGIEPAEKSIMDIPPRDSTKSLFSNNVGWTILYQGFVQTLIVLIMFIFAKWTHGNNVASTMSFLTICLMQIIHAINCKTEKSIFKTKIFKNHFFNFSFVFLLGLVLTVYFVPALASLFGLVKIPNVCWIHIIITSLSIIPLVEFGKLIIKKH